MDKVEEAIDERQSERKEEQESEKQLGATGTEGPREPSF